MGIVDHLICLLRNLYSGQEATVRTEHGTTDWFKIGKEYNKAVYCYPAYLACMQSTPYEMLGWKNHKLESRLPREMLTLDMQMCVLVTQSCLPATPWTVASVLRILQARILSGWPFPSSGDLPDPGIEPGSPALQVDSSQSKLLGKPRHADDTTLIAESKEELESLDETERGERKSQLETQHERN